MRDDGVELAGADRAQERRAFDEIVARHGKHAALSACPAIVWPERPTRWSSVAMRCGDPIWQTRSTWPMSMPSSSDAVATSAFSCPDFSRVSASSRFSFDRLPWCAVTASSPSRSLRWRASRSAIRRVFTNISVVRWARDQRGEPVVVLLPDLVRHHRIERGARHLDAEIHLAAVAVVDDGAAGGIAGGRETWPPPRSASASRRGRCAAAGARQPAASRSSDSARCAPRRVPMTAWISSTITVRTVRSICRLRSAVSSRYSDSGVVTRMCGGVRSIAARSDCVVSPVRTAAVILGASKPGCFCEPANAVARLGEVLVDVGAQRLQRRDVDDPDLVRQRRGTALFEKRVDRGEERRERLARAGRRGDERVAAGGNGLPAAQLRSR